MTDAQLTVLAYTAGIIGLITVGLLAAYAVFKLTAALSSATWKRIAAIQRHVQIAIVGAVVAFVCLWIAGAERHEAISSRQWALLGATSAIMAAGAGWRARGPR